jgi:phosphatidylserine/phosphatidylglycerophosphate/cardiolipin synthase-like enzyme
MVRPVALSIQDAEVAAEHAWPVYTLVNHRAGGSTGFSIGVASSETSPAGEKDSWRTVVRDAEVVGGVLFDTEDPVVASRVLLELLQAGEIDIEAARSVGLEPVLVDSLKRKLPSEPRLLELACAEGAGWVLGRRSCEVDAFWEAVASLPQGVDLPQGLRRTTGETMIGLASSAQERIRLSAPYIDESGMSFLVDSLVAATKRGVSVELFDPQSWEPARNAIASLVESIQRDGDMGKFHLLRTVVEAPFTHLKVMVVDAASAYIGSANITAAGLAGRNLELGVLVRGPQVSVIDSVLDIFKQQAGT